VDQTISQTNGLIDTTLSGLANLPVQLAIIVVVAVLVISVIWLVLRPYLRREQNVSEAITRLADASDHRVKLERKVGDLELQINQLSHDFTITVERIERERADERRRYEEERKTIQTALDEANKKLDDLKVAASKRESELLEQNAKLTEEIAALRHQVADLQMQLNQFLKLPEIRNEEPSAGVDL
jgi:chromosome segregation ATPase